MSEGGLADFLVLLSVHQTCKYRGLGFLKFLLSRNLDVGSYRDRKKAKNCAFTIEMYPEGFPKWGQNPQASAIHDNDESPLPLRAKY
jgi:hypothetical protein